MSDAICWLTGAAAVPTQAANLPPLVFDELHRLAAARADVEKSSSPWNSRGPDDV